MEIDTTPGFASGQNWVVDDDIEGSYKCIDWTLPYRRKRLIKATIQKGRVINVLFPAIDFKN